MTGPTKASLSILTSILSSRFNPSLSLPSFFACLDDFVHFVHEDNAVLFRAVEPLEGIGLMQVRRGVTRFKDLARGPGRLAQAMEITLGLDGIDLTAPGPLWLGRIDRPAGEIGVSIRIGISKEAERLLRFFECGSPYVSGPRRLNVAGATV